MAIFFAYAQNKVRKYVSDSGPRCLRVKGWGVVFGDSFCRTVRGVCLDFVVFFFFFFSPFLGCKGHRSTNGVSILYKNVDFFFDTPPLKRQVGRVCPS